MTANSSGASYEHLIGGLIRDKGHVPVAQVDVGRRPDGRRHRADFVVGTNRGEVIVSCKYQGSKGTAEEKLAFEVVKLAYTLNNHPHYRQAYLVLGGDGWDERTLKFARNELLAYIRGADKVVVLTTREFAALPML